MTDTDPLETRLRRYLADLAAHADPLPLSRSLPSPAVRRPSRPAGALPRRLPARALATLCAVAVATGALVLVRFAGRGPDSSPGQGAVLLTAAPVPIRAVVAEPADGRPGDRRLFLFESAGESTRPVGPVDAYSVVRLSPRGDLIAALAGGTLHLVSVEGGADRAVTLPPDTAGDVVVWAPDGTHVAVAGRRVVVIDATGKVVADRPAASAAGRSGTSGSKPAEGTAVSSGGEQWSPDGRWFAAVVNGRLIVAGADGSTVDGALSQLLPGLDDPSGVVLAGWSGDSTVVLGVPPDGFDPYASPLPRGWVVALPTGAGTLRAARGADLSFSSTIPAPADSARRADLERFAANPQVMRAYRTADGRADVYEIRTGPPSGGGTAPVLVVFVRGTTEAVRLPSLTDTGNGDLVDAVLAG